MSSDHDPGRSASDADPAPSPEPSQGSPGSDPVQHAGARASASEPAGGDVTARASASEPAGNDASAYAALYDTLTRVIASGPRWRRWLTVATDVAQASWQRGYAAVSEAAHMRHRRLLTIAAAGATALALSMSGMVATVQESWTPARIGSALRFETPASSAGEEPRTPVEQSSAEPSPAAPAPADRRIATDPDETPEADTRGMTVKISITRQPDSDKRSTDRARPRTDRSTSREAPDAAGDSVPTTDSRPAEDTAPEPAPAAAPATKSALAPATRANLGPGSRLASGDMLRSPNGRFALVMQEDGNLVLYRTGDRAIWSSGTHGNPGAILVNQPDGNVVVNAVGGRPLWSTRTAGKTGGVLVMQDDGNAVVYAGGAAVWASGTAQ